MKNGNATFSRSLTEQRVLLGKVKCRSHLIPQFLSTRKEANTPCRQAHSVVHSAAHPCPQQELQHTLTIAMQWVIFNHLRKGCIFYDYICVKGPGVQQKNKMAVLESWGGQAGDAKQSIPNWCDRCVSHIVLRVYKTLGDGFVVLGHINAEFYF